MSQAHEDYKRYKKEFINCLIYTIPGLGFPLYNAFKEWLPKMRLAKAETEKE